MLTPESVRSTEHDELIHLASAGVEIFPQAYCAGMYVEYRTGLGMRSKVGIVCHVSVPIGALMKCSRQRAQLEKQK